MQHLEAIAQPTPFVCPDCKGGLWQIDNSAPVRYRCHTGHAYTLKTLQQALTETMDSALWTAVRALQEQSVLLAMLAMVQRQEGAERHAVRLDLVREGIDQQSRRLRELAAFVTQQSELRLLRRLHGAGYVDARFSPKRAPMTSLPNCAW